MSSGPPFDDHQQSQYRTNLLGVAVKATVTLAATRASVGKIVELAPGSILRFDQPSTSPLELRVGRRTIAHGHPVEIGRQLGLVVTSLVVPARPRHRGKAAD